MSAVPFQYVLHFEVFIYILVSFDFVNSESYIAVFTHAAEYAVAHRLIIMIIASI